MIVKLGRSCGTVRAVYEAPSHCMPTVYSCTENATVAVAVNVLILSAAYARLP